MPSLTYILDELASIDEYLSACDVGDGRADVINSLQSMIKSAGTLTMTDAAKVATAIKGASSLNESDVKSLHVTLQQQVSAGMVSAPRNQAGNTIQQSFTERMSCGAMLTENVWDYLMATNIQFDLKLQHIVDFFGRGGMIHANEYARADMVSLVAACHYRHSPQPADPKLLYAAVHRTKRMFDSVRSSVQSMIVWPASPSDFPRDMYASLYGETDLPVPCKLMKSDLSHYRMVTSCRKNARNIREPSTPLAPSSSTSTPQRMLRDASPPHADDTATTPPSRPRVDAVDVMPQSSAALPTVSADELAAISANLGWRARPTVNLGALLGLGDDAILTALRHTTPSEHPSTNNIGLTIFRPAPPSITDRAPVHVSGPSRLRCIDDGPVVVKKFRYSIKTAPPRPHAVTPAPVRSDSAAATGGTARGSAASELDAIEARHSSALRARERVTAASILKQKEALAGAAAAAAAAAHVGTDTGASAAAASSGSGVSAAGAVSRSGASAAAAASGSDDVTAPAAAAGGIPKDLVPVWTIADANVSRGAFQCRWYSKGAKYAALNGLDPAVLRKQLHGLAGVLWDKSAPKKK